VNGSFEWATGEKLHYSNWASGQPDDAGGVENYVEVWANGTWDGNGFWNDTPNNNYCYGLVEVQGKANKLSLSKAERALIGNWYEGGDIKRPCWIAGTDKMLFVISNNKFAARASLNADGTLFVRDYQNGRPMFDGGMPMVESGFGRYNSMPSRADSKTGMSGEILKDKILWSNGTWWSRKPMESGKDVKSLDDDSAAKSADVEK
jgi:hypothetical protein